MQQHSSDPIETCGQDLVAATVHLAGAVEVETGHVAHYSAVHVQARIGSALLYVLDARAARDLAAAAAAAQKADGGLLGANGAGRLPEQLQGIGQEASVIVRLRGAQALTPPRAVRGGATLDGRPHVICPVGRLVFVCHTAEALRRLVHVTHTAARVAAALWPQQTPA